MVESGGLSPSENFHAGIQVVRVTDCGKTRSSRCEGGGSVGRSSSKHFLGVSSRQENWWKKFFFTQSGNIGESISLPPPSSSLEWVKNVVFALIRSCFVAVALLRVNQILQLTVSR